AHIDEVRRDYSARINQLSGEELKVTDPVLETSSTSFFLAYHGLGNKQLQHDVAALHLKSCPELAYTAPHCGTPSKGGGKIKVGFISAYFRRHSIGRLMQGVIENLPRDVFEVVVITQPGRRDPIARAIGDAADKVIMLPDSLAESRDCVAKEKLDILFYAEIGMDVRTYFMAFARLARVQCTTWGHPDTTGIPNLDYFLSSDLIETEIADDHYSEKLFRLSSLPTYYYFPDLPKIFKSRVEFGLPEDRNIYVCLQSVIKHHPDLDEIIGGILRGDKNSEVVLIEAAVPNWTEQVRRRMGATISDVADRVRSLARMGPEDFLSLINAADVIFDSPHFSGGNTSFDAFALGKSVVAHDGEFMRGRVTSGMYRAMDIDDMIGDTPKKCAEIALRLGTDLEFRNGVEAKIAERREILFENKAAINEMTRFLIEIHAGGGD
ncbi:MAG: hypothetical protein HQ503_18180, partial [Rhodospirillales bacterium]|nr:hypothetical protein [Rhodospirillales bacterium]